MKSLSKDVVISKMNDDSMGILQTEQQKARAENAKANKEYESLKGEVIKAVQGKSSFSQDLLSDLVNAAREKVISTSHKITELSAKIERGDTRVKEMQEELDRLLTWSEIFDQSDMEVKKMIAGYIIKRITILSNYQLDIELNFNVEQFLKGIDNIEDGGKEERLTV